MVREANLLITSCQKALSDRWKPMLWNKYTQSGMINSMHGDENFRIFTVNCISIVACATRGEN